MTIHDSIKFCSSCDQPFACPVNKKLTKCYDCRVKELLSNLVVGSSVHTLKSPANTICVTQINDKGVFCGDRLFNLTTGWEIDTAKGWDGFRSSGDRLILNTV